MAHLVSVAALVAATVLGTGTRQAVVVYTLADSGVVSVEHVLSRSFKTAEGTFESIGDEVVEIEGQRPLHVFRFTRGEHEGEVVVIGQDQGNNMVRVLRGPNLKASAPTLGGIEALPERNAAEVLLLWRHPGQGGVVTLEKYRYSGSGLEWVTSVDNGGRFGHGWVTRRGRKGVRARTVLPPSGGQ